MGDPLTTPTLAAEPGSFRDRSGRIYYRDGVIYRGVNAAVLADWRTLSTTRFFAQAMEEGKIVRTTEADLSALGDPAIAQGWSGLLRHDTIPFISYPYEWSFGMLREAALLQLELLGAALREGFILKDSSSFNIQWDGTRPVFIDVPSFERLAPNTPWLGYLQFCRMFLYPLFLQAYKDVDFHALLRGNIDGPTPEEFVRLLSLRDRLRPGVFTNVYLHAKMQARYAAAGRQITTELRNSGFSKELIESNVAGLRRLVGGLSWKRSASTWADYANDNSYSGEGAEAKAAFVASACAAKPRTLAWDVGCNTGTFSRIAARHARHVVAMDSDHLAVERLYQELRRDGGTAILPLVVNLANASPNLGWRGLERKALTGRARPDLILALALVHHMVISANIPLAEFVGWLSETGGDLVIEFVSKEDPMVKLLLRNRVDQYDDYTLENFRRLLAERYHIRAERTVPPGTRTLFHAERR